MYQYSKSATRLFLQSVFPCKIFYILAHCQIWLVGANNSASIYLANRYGERFKGTQLLSMYSSTVAVKNNLVGINLQD